MNFYLIGSLEGFNDLRFPNVEDWQNCMGHAEGLLKQWNPPEMEYIWKKSNRHKHFDLSQFCNPLLTISDKALSILENILIKNGEILDIKSPKGFYFFLRTKLAIIGEIWKSRAKLLRNRIFEKIASVTG